MDGAARTPSRRASRHSDPLAAALTASIGARAFAAGQDIYLGAGELARPSDAGELLAHEATHATLHPSGVAADGAVLVHAWLKGTGAAMQALGGGRTSGKLARKVGAKSNWDLILEGLTRYEKAEDAARAQPMSPLTKVKVAGKLMKLLKAIQSAVEDWEKANNSAAAQGVSDAAWADKNKKGGSGEFATQDDRAKSQRRQAIAMLRPRLADEAKHLASGEWASRGQLSDENRTGGKDAADKGGINAVDKIIYGDGDDSFTGYFKADVGFVKTPQSHESKSGIRQHDPNYGARSVAMSRLDTLLGTNVIAKTEFATHGGKLGTVMEAAKGSSMGEKGVAPLIQHETQRGNDTSAIAMDDPVLQSCLNKLQVIDAIAGQLDRHGDNYFVQQDAQGKVTGIKGIDLDMAFGAQMKTATHHEYQAFNYVGMAKLVDADLGNRILNITDEQIRAALKGLLTREEVDATVERFDLVRRHVQQLAGPNGAGLTPAWTSATAQATMGASSDPFKQESLGARELAYRIEWAAQDMDKVVQKSLGALLGKPGMQHDPAFKPDPVQWARLKAAPLLAQESFVMGGESGPAHALVPSMWAGELTPGQALSGAAELISEVIRHDLDEIALFAQANPGPTDGLKRQAKVNAAYKARAAKAAAWVKTSASLPQLPALAPTRGTRRLKRDAILKQLV